MPSCPAADQAFRAPDGPEVFHSVQHKNDVWKVDPFDVETIHPEARQAFRQLIARMDEPDRVTAGRILLLKGESGAGKTHLMRAFRNEVHAEGRGFFGYMQLTSKTDNYSRYILRNLIDSLDKPYYEPNGAETGLMRLSNAFAELPRIMRERFPDRPELDALTALREEMLSPESSVRLVQVLSDRVLREERFRDTDVDVVRAFLYLQSGDPLLKSLVIKFLRCEELSSADREALGGLTSRHQEDDPPRMLEQLGRLMAVSADASLVICVDQLEDIYNFEGGPERFRRAIGALRSMIDNVPNSVVVISCLEDYYQALREHLDRATLDRVEHDPEPVRLKGLREQDEVYLLVEKRLRFLYDSMDVELVGVPPYYPFPAHELDARAGMRTRDILDWCRTFQGHLKRPGDGPSSGDGNGNAIIELEQAWNDHLAAAPWSLPTDEEGLTALLQESLLRCRREREDAESLEIAMDSHGPAEYIRLARNGEALALRLCDKRPQGGALARELRLFEESARGSRLVILRTTKFPSNPKTDIARKLGRLIAQGAARFQVEPSEWHAMSAMPAFEAERGRDEHFAAWLRSERPLTRQPSLQNILGLLAPQPEPAPAPSELVEGPVVALPETSSTDGNRTEIPDSLVELALPADEIVVGDIRGLRPAEVTIEPEEFKRHAAFLGGSGSGKTTIALHIIEQLVWRGIPAILVDRKGDLCGYARRDAEPSEFYRTFRRQTDVAVYTPGDPRGRDLAIALLPRDAATLHSLERDSLASFCADSLAGMMNYKTSARDKACRGILKKAVEVLLVLTPDREITAEVLCDFVESQDPALLNEVGNLDSRHFGKLAEDLRILLLNKSRLLRGSGERLSAEALLGLGRHAKPGKTRLSIVSTKFIGDGQDIEFWITQLLLELVRWSSRAPSATLQGVVFFDEADAYLPAQSKPTTKGPMEDLLKRARSAGLGMLLATQSPGDFDYRCRDNIRTWFLGRIKEETALRKMKPMLSEVPGDMAGLLPAQGPGEFQLVRDGRVERMTARRNLLPAVQVPQEEILELARQTDEGG